MNRCARQSVTHSWARNVGGVLYKLNALLWWLVYLCSQDNRGQCAHETAHQVCQRGSPVSRGRNPCQPCKSLHSLTYLRNMHHSYFNITNSQPFYVLCCTYFTSILWKVEPSKSYCDLQIGQVKLSYFVQSHLWIWVWDIMSRWYVV